MIRRLLASLFAKPPAAPTPPVVLDETHPLASRFAVLQRYRCQTLSEMAYCGNVYNHLLMADRMVEQEREIERLRAEVARLGGEP